MLRVVPISTLLVLLAGPAAGLYLTHRALPPSGDDVVLAFDVLGDQGSYELQHGSTQATDLGQTFWFDAPVVLDKVTVLIRPEIDLGHDAFFLFVGTYSDPADHSMNEILHYELGGIPDDLPVGVNRYLTLDLYEPVSLQANRQYGFKIAFAGGGNVNDARARLFHMGDDAYDAGIAFDDYGGFTSALEYDLVFFLHRAVPAPPPPPPPPPPTIDEKLFLQGNRFEVIVRWQTADGSSGWGQADPMTDETGCFWFFGEPNLEIFVKVLDACSVYDYYWVFAAGLTDVKADITVTDRTTGRVRAYSSPLGQSFLPIYDVRAFATCP